MLNKQSVIFMNVKRMRIQRETKLLPGRSFQHMDTYRANGIKVLHVCHDMTVMNHTPINTGIVCNSKSFYFVSIFDFPTFQCTFSNPCQIYQSHYANLCHPQCHSHRLRSFATETGAFNTTAAGSWGIPDCYRIMLCIYIYYIIYMHIASLLLWQSIFPHDRTKCVSAVCS